MPKKPKKNAKAKKPKKTDKAKITKKMIREHKKAKRSKNTNLRDPEDLAYLQAEMRDMLHRAGIRDLQAEELDDE